MRKYFIDRNQAVNALNEAQIEGTDTYKGLGLAKQIIDKLPCECRPNGEWIEREDYNGDPFYDCSICGESFATMEGTPEDNLFNFCPNCGADMRGKAE